jgi:Excalibur calcium-binding domain
MRVKVIVSREGTVMRHWGLVAAVVAATASFAFTPASFGVVGPASTTSPTTGAAVPRAYPNCSALNRVYPDGVGRVGARDRVRGDTPPVTTFKRSNTLYRLNTARDRDKDGIACEKR